MKTLLKNPKKILKIPKLPQFSKKNPKPSVTSSRFFKTLPKLPLNPDLFTLRKCEKIQVIWTSFACKNLCWIWFFRRIQNSESDSEFSDVELKGRVKESRSDALQSSDFRLKGSDSESASESASESESLQLLNPCLLKSGRSLSNYPFPPKNSQSDVIFAGSLCLFCLHPRPTEPIFRSTFLLFFRRKRSIMNEMLSNYSE